MKTDLLNPKRQLFSLFFHFSLFIHDFTLQRYGKIANAAIMRYGNVKRITRI